MSTYGTLQYSIEQYRQDEFELRKPALLVTAEMSSLALLLPVLPLPGVRWVHPWLNQG